VLQRRESKLPPRRGPEQRRPIRGQRGQPRLVLLPI
jgi:hypothetical protein